MDEIHPVFTAKDFENSIKNAQVAQLKQMVFTIRESMERGESSRLFYLQTPVPNNVINAIFNYLDNKSNLLGKERSD